MLGRSWGGGAGVGVGVGRVSVVRGDPDPVTLLSRSFFTFFLALTLGGGPFCWSDSK